MTSDRTTVTVKDVKAFLPQVNCQIAKSKLKEVFNEVNNRSVGELSFDEFASLLNLLTYDGTVYIHHLKYLLNYELIHFLKK